MERGRVIRGRMASLPANRFIRRRVDIRKTHTPEGTPASPAILPAREAITPPVPPQQPRKKKSKGLLAFFLILLCVAVAAGGMTVAYYMGRDNAYDPFASSGEVSYTDSIDVQVQEKPASSEGKTPTAP